MPNVYYVFNVFNAGVNVPLAVAATVENLAVLCALRMTSLHPPSKALLCGLTLSDLVLGVFCQPLHAAHFLSRAGIVAAPNAQVYSTSFVFVLISLLTMTSINTDRFLAVRLGCRYRQVVSVRAVGVILCFIWMAGGLLVCLKLQGYETVYRSTSAFLAAVCVFLSSLTFVNFYRKLVLHTLRISNSQPGANRKLKNALSAMRHKRRVANTVATFAALLLCFLPYCAVLVSRSTGIRDESWVPMVFGFVETLVLVNASLNPYFYCWRTRELRQSVRQRIRHLLRCCSFWRSRCEEDKQINVDMERASVQAVTGQKAGAVTRKELGGYAEEGGPKDGGWSGSGQYDGKHAGDDRKDEEYSYDGSDRGKEEDEKSDKDKEKSHDEDDEKKSEGRTEGKRRTVIL